MRRIALLSLGLLALVSTQLAVASSLPFKRVVVVIFENENYSDVLDNPFFAKLAKQGALLTNFMAERHPSQPNYIALIAGDTLGVTSDRNVNLNASHLGDLLESAGKHWKVYAEDYPGDCFTGATSGKYARKHVPFISFKNVQSSASRCANIVEGDEFFSDAEAGKLPEFSMYIPNLDNDGHDTDVSYADDWFEKTFGSVLADPSFLQDTLFIATFDESETNAPVNQIYTVLLGSGVVPGSTSDGSYNHYSLLKTIEDGLELGSLNRNDAGAAAISGIWNNR